MWLWRQRRLGYGQGGREEDASKGGGRGLEASEDSGTAVDASKVLKKKCSIISQTDLSAVLIDTKRTSHVFAFHTEHTGDTALAWHCGRGHESRGGAP